MKEGENLFYSKKPGDDIEALKDRLKETEEKLRTAVGHEKKLLEITKTTIEEGIKNITEHRKNTVKNFVEPSIKRLN